MKINDKINSEVYMRGKVAWLVVGDYYYEDSKDDTPQVLFTRPDSYRYYSVQKIVIFEVEDE